MKKLLLAAAFMCAFTLQAATLTLHTSMATWSAAMSGLSIYVEDFDDATLVPGLTVVSDAGSIGGGLWNDRVVLGGDSTTWNFGTGVLGAIGYFDLTPGGPGQGILWTVTFQGGGTASLSAEIPNGCTGCYYGFTSDMPVTSILVNAGSQPGVAETHNMNDLTFGEVPEPATYLLFGAGLAATALLRRRRQAAR